MTYPNDRDPQRQDIYTEPDRAKRVEETHYADGSIDRRVEQDRLYAPTTRDTSNTAQGILMGILITALLGLGVLGWYLLNRREPVQPRQTIIVPQSSPSPTVSPQPDINITVPNPSSFAPAPRVNTNVTVPSPSAPASPPASSSSGNSSSSGSGITTAPSPANPTAPTSPPTGSGSDLGGNRSGNSFGPGAPSGGEVSSGTSTNSPDANGTGATLP